MKLTTALYAVLPALALSAPAGTDSSSSSSSSVAAAPPASDYKWHVSGWSAGCARSGCYYDFNVTGPSVAESKKGQGKKQKGVAIPAFRAYCSGQQDWFRQCEVLSSGCDGVQNRGCSVSARLFKDENDPTNATIGVSYSWTHKQDKFNSPTYNYTGFAQSIFNQFAAPAQEFDVKPSQFTAVD